jgi:hypothetical protein
MEGKRETRFACVLGILLFLIGVVAYAALPENAPEQPIRMVLKNIGGNVLFDHKKHSVEDGYGIACKDCHHDMEDEKSKATACGECHKPAGEEALRRADALHKNCQGCHEEGGLGPVECNNCHLLK